MKVIGKIFKGLGITLLVLVILISLAIGGLNVAKFIIYKDYYAIASNVCKNPGLNDDFVCQGVAVSEENESIFVCGYMKDKSASRIYVTNENDESYYVSLTKNGKVFTGHVGGIATSDNSVYLANGGRIYVIDVNTLLDASNGDIVEIGEGVKVNTNASFVYSDDQYLYVGEFHDGGAYVIEGHESETAEGTHYAYCTKYALSDLSSPLCVYSIRDKVQGICFAPNGKVVMSTSYGLTDTIYYVYDESEKTDSGLTVDGAPLFYLDKLEKEVHGPAMGEDLDFSDGKIITLTESASNKYVFGKLFGAYEIVALELV